MRIEDLEAFVTIVDSGSLTEAARLLDASQPGLSRILRDLERAMEARLLARTGRGIELLPAGERFLAYAKTVLDGLDAAKADIAALSPDAMEHLRISLPLGIGRLVAPPIQRAFALSLPAVSVDVFEERTSQLSDAALMRRYDLSLAFVFDGETNGGALLFREEMYLVGTPDLAGPDGEPIALRDVAPMPLMLPPMTRFRYMVNRAFEKIDRKPTVVRELESPGAILAFVHEREGVAILPYSNIANSLDRDLLSVRPIAGPTISRQLTLLSRDRSPRGVQREARDLLIEVLRKYAEPARWTSLIPDR